mmetsp:Transcript_14071/g.42591  ORF Transcript_14071/g.42591 Transcript_14071/m.42591 type:complete len:269 (-) Transcript_14071:964-1770(-)
MVSTAASRRRATAGLTASSSSATSAWKRKMMPAVSRSHVALACTPSSRRDVNLRSSAIKRVTRRRTVGWPSSSISKVCQRSRRAASSLGSESSMRARWETESMKLEMWRSRSSLASTSLQKGHVLSAYCWRQRPHMQWSLTSPSASQCGSTSTSARTSQQMGHVRTVTCRDALPPSLEVSKDTSSREETRGSFGLCTSPASDVEGVVAEAEAAASSSAAAAAVSAAAAPRDVSRALGASTAPALRARRTSTLRACLPMTAAADRRRTL